MSQPSPKKGSTKNFSGLLDTLCHFPTDRLELLGKHLLFCQGKGLMYSAERDKLVAPRNYSVVRSCLLSVNLMTL